MTLQQICPPPLPSAHLLRGPVVAASKRDACSDTAPSEGGGGAERRLFQGEAAEVLAEPPPPWNPPTLCFNALESATANTSCHAKLALCLVLLLLAWR